MKKISIYTLILAIIIGIIAFSIFYFNKNANNNNSSYNAEKAKTNANAQNNTSNDVNNNLSNITKTPVEEEIASFSTKIYNKDPERQNNITITCSTLNNTEVANGATFSLCDTIGKSTTDKGYQEADIIVNGKKEQGLGGGNCQVSTTLYNAVLSIPELQITERHEHSGHVPYIEEGKDAAISYGSHDFKFVNNTGYTIKIVAENSPDAITIKLIKIS